MLNLIRNLAWPQWLRRAGWEYLIVFRCCCALFGCILLLVIQPSLELLTFLAFLPIIIFYVKPPADPVVIWIAHTLVSGVVLMTTWAWCTLGFKAADLVRDHDLDRQIATQLVGAQNLTMQPSQAQIFAILTPYAFQGVFVQPKPSAIWGAFIFVNIFCVWLIRAYRIRYFFIMVLAGILVLVYGTIGPLVPSFASIDIGKLYLIPLGQYLAIGTFCACFILPTSVSGTVLRSSEALFDHKISLLNHVVGTLSAVEDIPDAEALRSHVEDRHAELIDLRLAGEPLLLKLEPLTNYLILEPAFARVAPFHVLQFWRMQSAISISLQSIVLFSNERNQSLKGAQWDEMTEVKSLMQYSAEVRQTATHLIKTIIVGLEVGRDFCNSASPFIFHSTLSHGKREDILSRSVEARNYIHAQIIGVQRAMADLEASAEVSTALVGASNETHEATHETFVDPADANGITSSDREMSVTECTSLSEAMEAIEKTSSSEKTSTSEPTNLSEKASAQIHSADLLNRRAMDRVHLRGLLTICADVESSLTVIQDLLKQPKRLHWNIFNIGATSTLIELASKRSETASHRQPIMPRLLDVLASLERTGSEPALRNSKASRPNTKLLTDPESSSTSKFDYPPYGIKPSILRRTSPRSNLMQHLASPQIILSFKVAVLAVALSIPAFIKSNNSAKFYYEQKGIWAAVTAVFATHMFAGETLFGFVARVVGTFIGALIGLVCWYISAGSGTGNPYGLAAIVTVIFAVMVPYRLHSSNFIVAVTVTTTATLVVGYSYIDAKLNPPLNPGYGWNVAWKRFVVSSIGLLAAFLVGSLPHPTSVHTHVCRILSSTSNELGHLLSLSSALVEHIASGAGVNEMNGTNERGTVIATGGMRVVIQQESHPELFAERSILQGFNIVLRIRRKLGYNRQRLALTKLEYTRYASILPGHDRLKGVMDLQVEACDLLGLFLFQLQSCGPEDASLILEQVKRGSKDRNAINAALQSTLRTSFSLRSRKAYRDTLFNDSSNPNAISPADSERILADFTLDRTSLTPEILNPKVSEQAEKPTSLSVAAEASLSALISALRCIGKIENLTHVDLK